MPNRYFDYALEQVLEHEGGLSDHSADPGGITNFGVSLRFAANTHDLDMFDFDDDGDIDGDDIKAMNEDDAENVYRKYFWDRYRYTRLLDKYIATKVFDTCVNTGPRRAHKIAQAAANRLGHNLIVDGKLGSKSFAALNVCHPEKLLPKLKEGQMAFYDRLIERKPKFSVFRNGWHNRAYS